MLLGEIVPALSLSSLKEGNFWPGHPVRAQNSLLMEIVAPRVLEIDNYE